MEEWDFQGMISSEWHIISHVVCHAKYMKKGISSFYQLLLLRSTRYCSDSKLDLWFTYWEYLSTTIDLPNSVAAALNTVDL